MIEIRDSEIFCYGKYVGFVSTSMVCLHKTSEYFNMVLAKFLDRGCTVKVLEY